MSFESELVQRAAGFARRAHEGQVRKGDRSLPYFAHLESVARRVHTHGHGDELTLAAAYLHDVIEDQPDSVAELRASFPSEVVQTVELLSEQKHDAHGVKRPKHDRFRDYVAGLAREDELARRARIISCADKLDNTLALVASERGGRQLLTELNTRPGQYAHVLSTLRALYAPVVSASLLAAYDAAAAELLAYIDAWLPGRAVAIAALAHQGQFDKAGEPYILHPLRLMLRAATPAERMAAVLHDVVEDSTWTLERLRDEGFPEAVVDAVDRLTRRDGESYEQFIDRVLESPLASRVKLLDVEDNLDLTRLAQVSDADLERVVRYHAAHRRLRGALDG